MIEVRPSEFEFSTIKLLGLSLSGIRTAIAIPELSLCFDVAQGFPFSLNQKKFFISHRHLDHAAGIPYIISQKAMNSHPAPEFYMPEELVEPMTRIMKIWEEIEKHQYQYSFVGVTPNQEIPINPTHFVRPFQTKHRVPSLGYTLFSRKKKLRPEFANLHQDELLKKKSEGHSLQDELECPLVSFTGDTQIEFLDLAPEVKKSKVLLVECTYLDDKRSVEHARRWGHIHFFELRERLSEIEAEKIVLIHLSSRYSLKDANSILQKTLSKAELERVVLFPGR